MALAVASQSEEKEEKTSAQSSADTDTSALQQSAGATTGLPRFLQTKLAVGATDDPLEQEADSVADAVTSNNRATPISGSAPADRPLLKRASPGIRSARNNSSRDTPRAVNDAVNSPGQPLDNSVRSNLESHLGEDFSDVRVHTDAPSAKSADSVNALAYTTGKDIVFAEGQYAPHTTEGQHLLAHEITHVVQQSGGTQPTPGNTFIQRQPAAPPTTTREQDNIEISTLFRGDFVPITIHLDEETKPDFDDDPALKDDLGNDLVAIFNPPEGPVPETYRFLSGPRVKALIEQDLGLWLDTGLLPSLSGLLTARAAALRSQHVRVELEKSLGVAEGTVDWNVQIPLIHSELLLKDTATTPAEAAKSDRVEMFLHMLESEVANSPAVVGGVVPPNLAIRVIEYAGTFAYNDDVRSLFAEKFLVDYLNAIASIKFIPPGFDLSRFAPSGSDLAEGARDDLIDNFIAGPGDDLIIKFILDDWTSSGLNTDEYLRTMDLEQKQDSIIERVTNEFMKDALTDPNLIGSIREIAGDQARYDLLVRIVTLGHANEARNAELPGLANKTDADLDEDDNAIIHDPGTYYQTSLRLGQAINDILSHVSAGANVDVEALQGAQNIAGQAEIPRNFGTFVFLLEVVTHIAALQQTVADQRSRAKERFATRMRVSWERFALIIRNFANDADFFIKYKWVPMLKLIAIEQVTKNYNDIKTWRDNFETQTPQVASRYRLAAIKLEELAADLSAGTEKSAVVGDQTFTVEDVPKMGTAVAYLRAKADKLESKEGSDEKKDDLNKAMDAYDDVLNGIINDKYKPTHYGKEIAAEASKRLGIGDFDIPVTYGQALFRKVTVRDNPFERWAIVRYQFFDMVYEQQAELNKFAIAGLSMIASFLFPGVAAAVLFVIDTGYGIYQGYQGVKQAQAVVDLARLDTDLKIQGVTVEEAKAALHDAKIGLFIAIALAGAIPAVMIVSSIVTKVQGMRALGALSKADPELALKITQKAGGTRLAGKFLLQFGGDTDNLLRALEHVPDGGRLDKLLGKVKDADLALRLLDKAGGEEELAPLMSRFKDYMKLEKYLGEGVSAEKLVGLVDLAGGEKNFHKLLDVMEMDRATAFLDGGLSVPQALAMNHMPLSAVEGYMKVVKTGDEALIEGSRNMMSMSKGKFENPHLAATLEKLGEFTETTKLPAGADYVKRFENISEKEAELDKARQALNDVKKAKGDTYVAQKRVDRLTKEMGETRKANYPGEIRPVDVTPEELKASPELQKQLFEECQGVQQRMIAKARGTLSNLGIDTSLVSNQLKRSNLNDFSDGVLKKMMDRKPYKNVNEMDDMVRGRFNLATREDVERVQTALRNDPSFVGGDAPRAVKGIPSVKEGYPRYHIILKDAETGITHEWQIGTEATSRLFEAPASVVEPIAIPDGLTLKPGMQPNIHDIEYDIFGAIQNSGKAEDAALADKLGIPKFREDVAELAQETGRLGVDTPNLDHRIGELHTRASDILAKVYKLKGHEYIEHFFH